MDLFRTTFDRSPYLFTGSQLREIAFPLGGIGTGCVSLDGRGGLCDWEIFNRPNKGSHLGFTFPLFWWKSEGDEPQAICVQGPRVKNWIGPLKGDWTYGHGIFFDQLDGLPCFDSVEFSGTFPFVRVSFCAEDLPFEIELCAFNPLIPLEVEASSFPGACLVYRVKNTSDKRIDASLIWSMMNPVGEGTKLAKDEKDGAVNTLATSADCAGIQFRNDRFEAGSPHFGTAALTTNWPNVTTLAQWDKREWFDTLQAFWNALMPDGKLEGGPMGSPGDRTAGSLGAVMSLEPGEEVEVPFFISWVFPNATKYWDNGDHSWHPHYSTCFSDAFDAASEFWKSYEDLAAKTLEFERCLFDSTLPSEVIQSVSATASILHSPTILRLEDGTFWAWEGCGPESGCCSGTCSHVWNYSLAHAFLFPQMQESMRRADYANSFNCGPRGAEGAMNFRVMIPLGAEAPLWHAASDGQLGGVVQLYRDWRLTGDEKMLRDLWPAAKRALEFAWTQWDLDRDGLAERDMHNTYDINFQGPNPLTQFFYLAALRAGEEMASHLGDSSATVYRGLYESGRKLTAKRIWNGDFFIQEPKHVGPDAPKYQHGHGCLSDQVFGQWSASAAGLGDLVEDGLVKQALLSIHRHNFKPKLGRHVNLQRVYAVQDEPGLILCSWPKGGRPDFPFVYSDEVWTGIEYQVASHMAWEGLVDECLDIVQGIRKRYDGTRRNPWNEFECGSHYARAMASYGLLIGLSGWDYDARNRTVSLSPRIKGDFKSFFCTPSGWGQVSVSNGETTFDLAEGTLFPA